MGKTLSKSLFLLLFIGSFYGCVSNDVSNDEELFARKLNDSMANCDQIQLFQLELNTVRTEDPLVFNKGTKEFYELTKGFKSVGFKGEASKVAEDTLIQLLKNNKPIYEVRYSSLDGRVVDFTKEEQLVYGYVPDETKIFINSLR